MRIAIWHNLPSGGGKRALYDQVKGLLGGGHVLEAWCPPTADSEYLPLRDLIPEHVVPMETTAPSRFGRLGSYKQLASRLHAMDRHCQACAAQISEGHFDVLFASACMFFRTVPIARHVRIPTAIYLGEPYRWLYEALPTPPWMAAPPLRTFGRLNHHTYRLLVVDAIETQARRLQVREEVYSARAFDMILVNSLYSRESVLRAYGLDSKVCYLGVDTDRFVDRRQVRERIVVGIGALVPEKNVHLVIEALGRVPDPPRLVWIGNVAIQAYVQSLHALAASVGVILEIRIRISDAELVDVLNRASLMVYAPRLEPFGYAPLEANACGVPVVAVAEGGVRETVLDGVNGLLVDADAAGIGAAVDRLLADQQLARTLGTNGRRLAVERWSLASAADRLDSRLRGVVKAGRRTAEAPNRA
jgi:glycosyltransferase involved in cell wall biosynthesis